MAPRSNSGSSESRGSDKKRPETVESLRQMLAERMPERIERAAPQPIDVEPVERKDHSPVQSPELVQRARPEAHETTIPDRVNLPAPRPEVVPPERREHGRTESPEPLAHRDASPTNQPDPIGARPPAPVQNPEAMPRKEYEPFAQPQNVTNREHAPPPAPEPIARSLPSGMSPDSVPQLMEPLSFAPPEQPEVEDIIRESSGDDRSMYTMEMGISGRDTYWG